MPIPSHPHTATFLTHTPLYLTQQLLTLLRRGSLMCTPARSPVPRLDGQVKMYPKRSFHMNSQPRSWISRSTWVHKVFVSEKSGIFEPSLSQIYKNSSNMSRMRNLDCERMTLLFVCVWGWGIVCYYHVYKVILMLQAHNGKITEKYLVCGRRETWENDAVRMI